MPKRIVFDVDDDLLARALKYAKAEKNISFVAQTAFEEYVNRRDARNVRATEQNEKQIEDVVNRVLKEKEKSGK
jgi:hypothetical protein